MFVHAQAPCRIGIAGGGTDLPVWTRERTGYCLTLAIGAYAHAVAITRPDRQVVASYSRLDRAACATEIANGLIRESALLHGWEEGFEVHTMSEVPSHGSGLGVSSSIAVALSACFARMSVLAGPSRRFPRVRPRGRAESRFFGAGKVTPEGEVISWTSSESGACARDAWTVEIDRLRRPIGRQDHMAAAYGGLRLYRFNAEAVGFEGALVAVERTLSEDDARWVAGHLVLLRLPNGHDARAILSGARAQDLQVALEAVPVAVAAIEQRDLAALGEAIAMGQRSKLGIPGAVTDGVRDAVAKIGRVSGVRGVKVAGAGGGGHLVVVCDSEAVAAVEEAAQLSAIRVEPDFQGVQSEGHS